MDNKQQTPLLFKLSEYNPVSAQEKADNKGFIRFGADNLFPQYLRELAETSPVHGSLCISIGDMIAGKGIVSNAQDRVDALDCVSVAYGCAHDFKKYGGYYIEVIYTNDRSGIARLNHIPFEECRLAFEGEDEEIIGVQQSSDWANPKKKNKPVFIPKFNPLKSEESRQIYWHFNYTSGQSYPRPDYWSSINYIELAKQIGIYHVNNILNGLFPSFIVNFFNGQLDPDSARKAMREWEQKLSGARNAGKFIMTFNERDTQKPDIVPFPLSDADKQYSFLSELSTTEVMIAHRATTPLLFGIRTQTGFGSNKDEMAVGLEIFTNQVIEPAQRKLEQSFKDILSFEVENIEIKIQPNTPLAVTEAKVDEAANIATDVNVAAQALNGAQLDSLVQIILQVSAGALPIESGKAIVAAGFPTLTSDQINAIFDSIVVGAVSKDQVLSKAPKMTDEDEKHWLETLRTTGEIIDLEEWELLSEEEASTSDEEYLHIERIQNLNLAYESYDNADKKSKWGDKGLYKLRYAYSTNLSDDTREFCREMAMDSMLGRVYRYEDIVKMSNDGVNGEFAERGQSTYDIFTWKGGCYCHHKWLRRVYFRKQEKGRFLPNKGLDNDIRVGNVPFVPQKGKEGVRPIDTPSRGKIN